MTDTLVLTLRGHNGPAVWPTSLACVELIANGISGPTSTTRFARVSYDEDSITV